MREPQRLDLNVEHLPAAIHPIGRVYAVWAIQRTILGVFSQLRQRKLNGSAALAAALLGLFAFWLSHERCGSIKFGLNGKVGDKTG